MASAVRKADSHIVHCLLVSEKHVLWDENCATKLHYEKLHCYLSGHCGTNGNKLLGHFFWQKDLWHVYY